MKDALIDRPLAPSGVIALLLLYAAVGAPHLAHLGLPLMLTFYGALVWRALAVRWPRLMPGLWLRVLLTLGAVGLVVWSVVGALDGRALGVGLLTVMAGLKCLEVRSRRDLYVAVFLGFFLIATQFLFDQGLWMTLYLMLPLLGLVALLAHANRVAPPPWPHTLRDAGVLLVAGLPMALLLFVLFPRLANPLWAIAAPSQAVTGMTDRIEPGTVSQLSQSGQLAFRVRFEDERPAPRDLYWRGPVFWDTDGRAWLAGTGSVGVPRRSAGEVWRQEVTLEPSQQRWLFALDRPTAAPAGARLTVDGQLVTGEPVTRRRVYQVRSQADAGESRLSDQDRRRALFVPADMVTPRMTELVGQWLAADSRPATVVQQALAYFRREPFVYTLQPPALPDKAVDRFLFDTRRGFCEHYATSFTVLMRLAGIPARMVAGYQGGEWNPVAEHLSVRQSDAHAWAEVWLGDRWQRVDPTAAVAPERIERAIAPGESRGADAVRYRQAPQGWLADAVRNARWWVDGVELGWQRWVVGYSDRTQRDLLSSLGLGWLTGYGLAVAAVLAGALGMLPLWWLLRRRNAPVSDPARAAWQTLLQRLRKAGLALPGSLPPTAVAARARQRFPDERQAIDRVVGLYLGLRYGPGPTDDGARRLRRAVRRLRLRL